MIYQDHPGTPNWLLTLLRITWSEFLQVRHGRCFAFILILHLLNSNTSLFLGSPKTFKASILLFYISDHFLVMLLWQSIQILQLPGKKIIPPIKSIETYKRQTGLLSCATCATKLYVLSYIKNTRTYSCINGIIHRKPAHHYRENLYWWSTLTPILPEIYT